MHPTGSTYGAIWCPASQRTTPALASRVALWAALGLAGMGPALADPSLPDLPDVSAQLAALPDIAEPAQAEDAAGSDDWTDESTTASDWFTLALQAGQTRTRMASPSARLAGDVIDQSYVALVLGIDTDPLPGLAIKGTAVALAQDGDTTTRLQDLSLSYALSDTVQISLGKTYPAWSFSELAHVLDPSLVNAARVDPDDVSVEYAHPFGQAQLVFGDHRFTVLGMAESHDFADLRTGNALAALRYQTHIGDANLSAHVLRRASGTREAGFGLDMPAGPALLSFETTYAEHRRLPGIAVLPNGARLTAPDAGGAWQATLAARAPLGANWQAEALYLYNGHGYDHSDWRAYLDGEAATLDAMARFDFTHADFLGAARDAHDGQFLRQNYLAASLSSKDGLLPWGLTFGAYAGLDDGGGFAFAAVDRDLGQFGTVSLDLSSGFGPDDSEFARRPDRLSLTLRMEF